MKRLILAVLAAFVLSGCAVEQAPVKAHQQEPVNIEQSDMYMKYHSDSMFLYNAYMHCQNTYGFNHIINGAKKKSEKLPEKDCFEIWQRKEAELKARQPKQLQDYWNKASAEIKATNTKYEEAFK